MKRRSFYANVEEHVGDYGVHVTQCQVSDSGLRAQTELWNGAYLHGDLLLLGKASARKGFLRDAQSRATAAGHPIDDQVLATIDTTLAEIQTAIMQRQIQRRQPATDATYASDSAAPSDATDTTKNSDEDEEDDQASQATLLVELAAGWELFHDPGGVAYATVKVQARPAATTLKPGDEEQESAPPRRQTRRLQSTAIKRLLSRLFYQTERKTPRTGHCGGPGHAGGQSTLRRRRISRVCAYR